MNINFAFLRHGYGCHNAMSNLVNEGVISYTNANKFLKKNDGNLNVFTSDIVPLNDPVLTNVGVEASIYNGCIINKILRQLPNLTGDKNLQMDKFNVVGCSPLIRCMETAYYMTRKWKNPPKQIYVFPLLREIDESSNDKYSETSKDIMRITPSYAILPIQEQKMYLKKLGILEYFDFSFVESFPQERIEPGDIHEFIKWFKYFVNLLEKRSGSLNVFVTTHAGVLRDFSKTGYYNNSGFVINTTKKIIGDSTSNKHFTINKLISLNDYITSYNFFRDYQKYNKKSYYCPSDRCGQLCSVANGTNGTNGTNLKQIGLECNLDEEFVQEKKIIGMRKTDKTGKTGKTDKTDKTDKIRNDDENIPLAMLPKKIIGMRNENIPLAMLSKNISKDWDFS